MLHCFLLAGAANQQTITDVYQTSNSYVAAYHYLQCGADALPVPTTTAEVATIIAGYYAKAAAGQQVTVRASRPKFHSTATFVCPTAPAAATGSKAAAVSQEASKAAASGPLEVAILHNKLNKVCVVTSRLCALQL
jgi:hypothetical protein